VCSEKAERRSGRGCLRLEIEVDFGRGLLVVCGCWKVEVEGRFARWVVSVVVAAVWRWFARGEEGKDVNGFRTLGERYAFWSSILEMSDMC